MKVYFSHTGVNNLMPMIDVDSKGTFLQLVDQINCNPKITGIKSKIALEGKILSSARIFINVDVKSTDVNGSTYYKFYEKENTQE